MSEKSKFLVIVNDGKREAIYKGVLSDTMANALESAVAGHLGIYRDVDKNDIEATSCKMA